MKNKDKSKDFGKIFITNTAENKSRTENNVIKINPEHCTNWKYSDRSHFELGDLNLLGNDIKKNGQIQPIVVRKKNKNSYEVIAGERRWRACKLIGIPVMAIEIFKDDMSSFLAQYSENIKRSISPYSKSMSYRRVLDDNIITQNELAEKIGMSKSSFSELMSFSFVSQKLWDSVEDMTKVSSSTASFIRKLINDDDANLKLLIIISDKIRKGAGRSAIKKILDGKNNNDIVFDEDGKKLMYIKKNKIEFEKSILSKITTFEIAELIKNHLNSK